MPQWRIVFAASAQMGVQTYEAQHIKIDEHGNLHLYNSDPEKQTVLVAKREAWQVATKMGA